jgi:DNA polymerase-1
MVYLITNQTELFPRYSDDIHKATVQDCLDYFKDKKEIALDTETMGFDPYTKEVLSLQLGDEERQYVIDTISVDMREFKELLEDEDKLILMQNAKFDLKFLYHYRIITANVFDTMLAEAVLTMGIKWARKSLDYLTYKYCKIDLDKTVRGVIHKEGLSSRVIKYAADDVKYLHEIKRKQLIKIKEQELEKALSLDNKFVKVLAYVEYSGFGFNQKQWLEKCDRDIITAKQAEANLDKFLFETEGFEQYIDNQLDLFSTDQKSNINWNSAPQVIPIMQKVGANTEVWDSKEGKYKHSIDKKVLEKQKDKHPLIALYVDYKTAMKLVTSFGYNYNSFINPVTNRIHTSYQQIMQTGRLSCGSKRNPKKGIPGYPNLQQIPADEAHRNCFIPEKGHDLIVCDYSGQESVIFANYSQEPELIKFYKEGMGDMHSFIASKIYPELEGLSLDEIKANHKDKRQNAKAAGFAIQFGGVGSTIARNLGLSAKEGDAVYNGYLKAFPEVNKYFNKCKKDVIDRGYVLINTVSNRKSYMSKFEEYQKLAEKMKDMNWKQYRAEKAIESELYLKTYKPLVKNYFGIRGDMERNALNYPIQGSGAEATKFAAVKIFNWIVNNGLFTTIKICNLVHDEIVVESPEHMSEEVAQLVQQAMEDAGNVFCKTIPLVAQPCITKHWEH